MPKGLGPFNSSVGQISSTAQKLAPARIFTTEIYEGNLLIHSIQNNDVENEESGDLLTLLCLASP